MTLVILQSVGERLGGGGGVSCEENLSENHNN